MDKKILQTLQKLQETVIKLSSEMLTKSDAKNFAAKDDLKNFATKNDLKNFATKNDLRSFENRFEQKFATKDDLKNEIEGLKMFLTEEYEKADMQIVASADKAKAEKAELENLKRRVTKIEQQLRG